MSAPAPLATAAVFTNNGTVVVPCEPINEWLAITPVFGMDADGKTWLDGTFSITHLATGRAFSEGSGCIVCCRESGKVLNRLPLDWAALTGDNGAEWLAALNDYERVQLATARAVEWGCDAEYCGNLP